MTTTYVVATTEVPTIVCPPWCAVPEGEHIADLPNWEGWVLHQSSDRELPGGIGSASISVSLTPAGEPDPTEALSIYLHTSHEVPLSPAETIEVARRLVALAEEASR